MSGTIAPKTGAPKASPMPSAKMQPSTAPGSIALAHAPKARNAEQAPCHSKAITTKARRLTMSATAPAGSVKRKNGAEAAVAMSDSERDEAPRSCINHVADMSCAERNVPDKTLASHIRQKTGFRSGNQVEVDFTSVREREISPPNGVNRQASGIFEQKSSETVPACAFP